MGVPVNLVTGYSAVAGLGYPYHFGYGVAPVVAPFVAHPNGALVPAEPKEVVDARAEHLAAHERKRREAQVPVGLVTGYSAFHTGYPYHFGYGVAPVVSPFVAHPNGALVPAEPEMWWMPVLSIWPPMLRHKLVGGSLILKTGR